MLKLREITKLPFLSPVILFLGEGAGVELSQKPWQKRVLTPAPLCSIFTMHPDGHSQKISSHCVQHADCFQGEEQILLLVLPPHGQVLSWRWHYCVHQILSLTWQYSRNHLLQEAEPRRKISLCRFTKIFWKVISREHYSLSNFTILLPSRECRVNTFW